MKRRQCAPAQSAQTARPVMNCGVRDVTLLTELWHVLMEPHNTSKPVTVPIVAACRAVSTTVSVLSASRERRRRPAKGRRSASASRRPGPASVSRSSTSRGGKGACLNGVAAAAAATMAEHAIILKNDGPKLAWEETQRTLFWAINASLTCMLRRCWRLRRLCTTRAAPRYGAVEPCQCAPPLPSPRLRYRVAKGLLRGRRVAKE